MKRQALASMARAGILAGMAVALAAGGKAEAVFQFAGSGVALDGSAIAESFTYASSSPIFDDVTVSAPGLKDCSIAGDICSYVSFYATGPGDTSGHHPEIEVGGDKGAFDYYFPYDTFVTAGMTSTIPIGPNSGNLHVAVFTPEPGFFLPLLAIVITAVGVSLKRARSQGAR